MRASKSRSRLSLAVRSVVEMLEARTLLSINAPSNVTVTPATINAVPQVNPSPLYVLKYQWTDNANNETGFDVRATSLAVPSEFRQVANMGVWSTTRPANTQSFDFALPPDEPWHASLRAVNETEQSS